MKLHLRNRAATLPAQPRDKSALPRDWVDSLPNRASRRRRLRNGRLVPVKADPRSRKVRITTGVESRAIRGELDRRYAFARTVSTYEREYREHVGADSVVLRDLCRSAAIHKAVFNLALQRLMDSGPLDDQDRVRAAYEAWRTADRDLREVSRGLGLERREKPLPDLQAYLSEKTKKPLRIARTLDAEEAK